MNIEYVKGTPYFSDTKEKIKEYGGLDKDLNCQVLVIGGGINGAMCLYQLIKAGIDCALIESNKLGLLSTSSATALLEYQLDERGIDLLEVTSKNKIKQSYNYGLESLDMIDTFIKEHGNKCEYNKRDTLIYTLKSNETEQLRKEYNFRKANNFDVSFLEESNNPLNFDLKGGIYSYNGGADFNPYLFTKQVIEEAEKLGAKIYEHTNADKIIYKNDGAIVIVNNGIEIATNKIICSTGYNTEKFTERKLCDKFVTYTIVTSPIKNFNWYNNALLQDNSTPYHYLKITNDNRMVVGGEDVKLLFNDITKLQANSKYKKLEDYIYKLYPVLKDDITIDYKFCGQFATTIDNMGIIGQSTENEHLWYCLGYGANGIIYAMKGGKMLADLYKGKYDPYLKLFEPSRILV
jgi:glycine/D-amino acid oxidase-like deaminating enzyme